MRFFKLCIFLSIFNLSSLVLAGPATHVGGAENLSNLCAIQAPIPCPSERDCPRCEDCPETPVCDVCTTPSQPSSPSECKGYYQLDFKHSGVKKKTDIKIDQTGATELSCFESMVNKLIEDRPHWGLPDFDSSKVLDKKGNEIAEKTGKYFSIRLWDILLAESGLSRNSYQDNKKLINCTGGYRGVTHNGHAQMGGGVYDGNYTKQPGCVQGSLYLDSSCNLLDARNAQSNLDKCGDIDLYTQISTPLSLVWSDSYKDVPSTIVNFKLNPHSDNNFWLWRGSESLPLLVYDPEHTGVINSATQLFGSWTFGGNGLASLIEGTTQGTPWKDGYEALSKMDKDLDGKVSGAELKDLALWFDKSQDGISQEGEVKTLSEVSVTALYYQADKKETGAIVASKGYVKEIDGKIIIASSMDWMEKGLKDGFDVVLDNVYPKDIVNGGQSKNLAKDTSLDRSEYAKDVAPEVYGVWGWNIDFPAKGSGFLAFDPSEKGISGVTLNQVGVLGPKDISSRVLFSHFEGSSSKNEEGLTEVKFEVSGENGAVLTNTASLSKDGKELLGKTVVSGSSLSESGSYEYTWRAVRLK